MRKVLIVSEELKKGKCNKRWKSALSNLILAKPEARPKSTWQTDKLKARKTSEAWLSKDFNKR